MAISSAASAAEFRCAAEARDGFAEADGKGGVRGAAVELCRSYAERIAGLGNPAKLILIEPDTGGGLPDADIVFFSRELIDERQIAARLHTGDAVFHDPVEVMVPTASPVMKPNELSGRVVCLMIGAPGQRALEKHLSNLNPPPIRLSFREPVEMRDAYNVGRCEAAIGMRTELAEMRRETGINRLQSRVLGPPLDDAPIIVAFPAK
jgi:general L-amino acid transport system substrate-binding protein